MRIVLIPPGFTIITGSVDYRMCQNSETASKLREENDLLRARIKTLETFLSESRANGETQQAGELLCIQRDLALALTNAAQPQTAISLLLEAACRIDKVDSGGVYLVVREPADLELVSHRGLSPRFVDKVKHRNEHTPVVSKVLEKETFVYKPTAESDPECAEEGLRLVIAMPLMHQGRLLGVMNCGSHTHAELPTAARQTLDVIAILASSVLAHLKTTEELERHRSHLMELVEGKTEELEQSRAKLQRSELLSSLGTFAAGIAHEVNNPLGTILLAARNALALKDSPEGPQIVDRCLNDIVNDAKRCSQTIRGILDFARHGTGENTAVDANQLINRVLDSQQKLIQEKRAVVTTELSGSLPVLMINPVEVEQALANVLRNALQSKPEGANVKIFTSAAEDSISIIVEDDGRGMSKDTLKHLFDPFFTTKHKDGGLGLGMSITYSIIEAHHGTVDAQSEIGQGTKITIRLPAGTAAPDTAPSS